MSLAPEDSPAASRASNRVPRRTFEALIRACRELGGESPGPQRQVQLLELALEATGAERAWIVSAGESSGEPRVEGCASRRDDGSSRPSRTVLRRALAGWNTFVCADAARDPRSPSLGHSFRELRLRSIYAAPLPARAGARRAIVLDGRGTAPACESDMRALVEAFAALVASVPDTEEPPAASPRRARPDVAGDGLVGRAPAFRRMLELVDRAARASLPVLVFGETGSGKERVARAIHERGPRRASAFVPVNCTALAETLLDAELFGAVRGAYTGSDRERAGLFREADGGTLFLDEVGDMSPAMQAKLLRVLQEGRVRPVGADRERSVDVRVVAATHHELARAVSRGRFRADLYFRLAVLEVRVPPLRERLDDLEPLVDALLPGIAGQLGRDELHVAPCALRLLRTHAWPGNVRELQAALARAGLRGGGRITAGDLSLPEATAAPPAPASETQMLERAMIEGALRACAGSVTRAAGKIGWTRQKLYRRMRALTIGPLVARSDQSEGSEGNTSSESSTFQ